MARSVRTRLVALLAVTLVAGTTPRTAAADAPTSASVTRAAQLKKQADTLMDNFKYAEAFALYTEAYATTADTALLYNQGRALEAMGDYPRALAKLEQFAATAPPEVSALVPALGELIADVRSRVSKLVVTCNVMGARILVRDQLVGTVRGTETIPVRAGKATVEILADGYEPFRKEVDLPGGAALPLEVTMQESRAVAVLVVKAVPDGSLVVVDGKAYGPAPVETKLGPGSHTVLLQHTGYDDANLPLVLVAGEHRTLEGKLSPLPSILGKWWFWVGVGAVVATGTAVTIALLTTKDADSGTFSPGQVRGPLTIGF